MTEEIKEIYIRMLSHTMHYDCCYDADADNDFEKISDYITNLQKENKDLKESNHNWQRKLSDYKQRNEKAVESAKEKIKRYESYIHDLKNSNYPSPTIRQERQELIFRIREQEDLLNILEGGDE